VRWTIERLVPGGDGLARLPDGRVGFATGALPGDRIEVFETDAKAGYTRARRWRLLRAGPSRVTPECPVAERCGGCDWMALARPSQIEHKAAIVRDALVRVGRLSVPDSIEVVSAGPDTRYRGRLRLHIDRSGRIGLFSRGSQRLVEIEGCLVCEAPIDEALTRLRALVVRYPGGLSEFDGVEIRHSPREPSITFCFFRRDESKTGRAQPGPVEKLLAELRATSAVDAGDGPAPSQCWPLPGGVELEAPTGVFTQVNWAVNERLVGAVVDGALSLGVQRFCDLYAGAGNFALALLARGLDGVAIEESRAAVASAERAKRRQNLELGRFVHGDVVLRLRELISEGEHFDLLIADPPRIGARDALRLIARLAAPHVALCSCDPPTLARDAAELVAAGYALARVTVFDMFPQTHHVEVLLWLDRHPPA
jgi:23S rRNA (uracil1939-C5)-methyltransferase